MNRPSLEDVKSLINNGQDPCLSLYFPYASSGNETEQNAIYLKNLLQEAERRLRDGGMRGNDAAKLLAPGYDLLEEEKTTTRSGKGMALFLDRRSFIAWVTPVSFTELVVDGSQFHTRPLLPLLFPGGEYFVLALALNRARLFRATRFELTRLDIPDLDRGIEYTLRFDEPEEQLQAHPGPPGSVHGHDVAHQNSRANLRRYLEEVDRSVTEALRDATEPLVVLAEDQLQGEYTRISRYTGKKLRTAAKNPDPLAEDDILWLSLPAVDALFSAPLEKALRAYRELTGTGKTTNSPDTLLRAAGEGRVQTMIVGREEYIWGRIDEDKGGFEAHASQKPGDDELFDLAASRVISHGGEVFDTTKEAMPGASKAVAIFRY